MEKHEFSKKMSKFKENVLEVLNDRGISIKDFCLKNGFGKNMIYDLDLHMPTLLNALKIANSLNVSIDYLVGRIDYQEVYMKKRDVNAFSKNLKKYLNNISKLQFCNDLHFSTDCFTRWENGAIPYLLTIIKIADYLKCSIDDLLEHE